VAPTGSHHATATIANALAGGCQPVTAGDHRDCVRTQSRRSYFASMKAIGSSRQCCRIPAAHDNKPWQATSELTGF